MISFGMIGAGGYIAPRHMKAIKENDAELVLAYDPSDSVGVLDSYFPDALFYNSYEAFHAQLVDLMISGQRVDYVTICSPNYMHLTHIKLVLQLGINVICEKPLALTEDEIHEIQKYERLYDAKVFVVLQLRLHPAIVELKKGVASGVFDDVDQARLQYVTSRGQWYDSSWKGDMKLSGGLATNIGIHFFDMLHFCFGSVTSNVVTTAGDRCISGELVLGNVRVDWMLSVDSAHLPDAAKASGSRTYRSLTIGDKEIEFSGGFTELHTETYRAVLSGDGFSSEDAREAVRIVEEIRKWEN